MNEASSSHRRRSLRIPGFDYSDPNYYFLTICAHQRACLFGNITGEKMILNRWGRIVSQAWQEIKNHFETVESDYFVVMPNHLHGLIFLGSGSPPLGRVVAYFKYQSTKMINILRESAPGPVWQRNYHEHIVRNDKDLARIREYIFNNPLQWHLDSENLNRTHPVGARSPRPPKEQNNHIR